MSNVDIKAEAIKVLNGIEKELNEFLSLTGCTLEIKQTYMHSGISDAVKCINVTGSIVLEDIG